MIRAGKYAGAAKIPITDPARDKVPEHGSAIAGIRRLGSVKRQDDNVNHGYLQVTLLQPPCSQCLKRTNNLPKFSLSLSMRW